MLKATDYARDVIGHGCIAIDRDGRAQAFTESIRDALIARGELTCVDGVWHLATRGTLDMVEHAPWLACCDFCSARPVTWNLACTSFQIGPGRSDRDWVACETCGALVTANDRAGLFRRASAAMPGPRVIIRQAALRDLHRQFWSHYQGQATRLPPRPSATDMPTPSLVCPQCGRVSHNPHDVAQRYCGFCHVFLDDLAPFRTMGDTDLLDAMSTELARCEQPIQMIVRPTSAMQLAGLVQLALRHPSLPATTRQQGVTFLEHVRAYFNDHQADAVLEVLRRGDQRGPKDPT